MNTTYVSASEISEYIYCQCCWADTQEGLRETTPAMEQGSLEHSHIQQNLAWLGTIKRLAIILIISSAVLLLCLLFFVFWFNLSL